MYKTYFLAQNYDKINIQPLLQAEKSAADRYQLQKLLILPQRLFFSMENHYIHSYKKISFIYFTYAFRQKKLHVTVKTTKKKKYKL